MLAKSLRPAEKWFRLCTPSARAALMSYTCATSSGPARFQMLKFGCILVYLKYWTLNLMPLMVQPKVLFHPMYSIKEFEQQLQSRGSLALHHACVDFGLAMLHLPWIAQRNMGIFLSHWGLHTISRSRSLAIVALILDCFISCMARLHTAQLHPVLESVVMTQSLVSLQLASCKQEKGKVYQPLVPVPLPVKDPILALRTCLHQASQQCLARLLCLHHGQQGCLHQG